MQRTITLTDRRPVKIEDEHWPIVAKGTGDTYSGHDYGRYQQALAQGECDRYAVRVRQHADGRALVYAVVDAADVAWHAPAGGIDHRGGVLLEPGADIPAAVLAVCERAGIPRHVADECIAELPAEDLR